MTPGLIETSRTRRPPRGGTSLRRGLHAPATLEVSDVMRAAAAVAGLDGASLIGPAAAWLLTDGRVDLPDPVPIAYRHHITQPAARQLAIPLDDRWGYSGIACTSPLRTASDILRREPRPVAIVTVDALLNRCRLVTDEIRLHLEGLERQAGQRRALQLLDETEPNAGSAQESLLRLVLTDGGLPRPVAQLIMLSPSGGFAGRADLGYPLLRLTIEYLGRTHELSLDADTDRLTAVREAGYESVGITASTMRQPGEAVRRVLEGARRQQQLLGLAGEFPLLG